MQQIRAVLVESIQDKSGDVKHALWRNLVLTGCRTTPVVIHAVSHGLLHRRAQQAELTLDGNEAVREPAPDPSIGREIKPNRRQIERFCKVNRDGVIRD